MIRRPSHRAQGRRGGFALTMVVLLLFAVGVAAATAYQVVRVEAELSVGNEEVNDALDVADGGLQRYLAESLGMPDTAVYAVGGGTATVYPRRLVSDVNGDPYVDLYVIRSEGKVADARYPSSPATRVVSEYAYLHRMPLNIKGALQAAYPDVSVSSGSISGNDAGGASCTYPTGNIYGVVKSGASAPTGSVSGKSPGYVNLASNAAVIDTAAVRWDLLQNPAQPVGPFDLEANWPSSFSGFPADSFPVLRAQDGFNGSFYSGQGVLIVPGTFSVGYGYFQWKGIILAGSIGSLAGYYPSTIDGMLVGGLDGGAATAVTATSTTLSYNRCYVIRAEQNIAYLEPLDATWRAGS